MKTSINQFVIRTPLFKLENLATTESALLQAYRHPIVRQALYLASRDLYGMLEEFENGADLSKERRDKMMVSLYKYYTRMCTRCTPFGLFAGITAGRIGEHSMICLEGDLIPAIRIDMDYLCNFYYEASRDRTLYPHLSFFPNQTLYKTGSRWRYVEYQFRENTDRFHNLVAVDDNEFLSDLLARVRGGLSYDEMLAVTAEYEVDEEEARAYLNELIESQVLISNLYPSVCGPFFQQRLFGTLEALPVPRYQHLNRDITAILEGGAGIIDKYRRVEDMLSRFEVKINSNHLLQVDLLRAAGGVQLSGAVRDSVAEATGILIRLKQPDIGISLLERFKRAFRERYEDKFMPLLQVMDTDIGIGYRNAVSADGFLQDTRNQEAEIRAVKIKLFVRALRENSRSVELRDEDLRRLSKRLVKDMPCSYSFIGNLFFDDDGRELVRYKLAGGSSALNILGRFGQMDAEIDELCAAIARSDQAAYPGAVLADIAHLPEGRVGNVVARPHFHPYEIPYMSFAVLPPEQQLQVSDLYIGVVDSRVVLFSKRMNKEVIPRLSNAHNFAYDGLPVYQLLCDLQTQNLHPGVYWSWDDLYSQEFLPRVTYKNIILSPARWNLETTMFRHHDTDSGLQTLLGAARMAGLPDKILIPQGDNELYLDLRCRPGAEAFLKECRKSEKVVIEEFLYEQYAGADGYAAEIVMPFFNSPKVTSAAVQFREADPEREILNPLSDWVYFKLYTGRQYAEKLLLEAIPALVKKLEEMHAVSKWFFVRYADPGYHLRVRFQLADKRNRQQVFEMVEEKLGPILADNLIFDLQVCTYMREVDRYGPESMEISETWFYHNSNMVLRLLPAMKGKDARQQMLIAMFCIDSMLNGFFSSPAGKAEFVQLQSASYIREFGVTEDKQRRQKMNDDFREVHGDLRQLVAREAGVGGLPVGELAIICREAGLDAAPAIAGLLRLYAADRARYMAIAGSYFHMFVNRLFREEQRYKEMNIYYFLTKFYASEAGRAKQDAEAGRARQDADAGRAKPVADVAAAGPAAC